MTEGHPDGGHISIDEGHISIHDYKPFGARFVQIRALLSGPVTDDTAEAVSVVLGEYQEIPELLDPYLHSLTDMIVAVVRSDQLAAGSAMLYTLCKIRGAAVVMKFLPHAIADFKFALALLQRDTDFTWQTRYSLLTWMSMLVILPFSLDTVVESSSGNVVHDLLRAFSSYLKHSAPTSTVAARAIARLLSRNDSDDSIFGVFIQWCRKELPSDMLLTNSADDLNRTIGVLNSFIQLLKTVSREKMLPYLDEIMDLFPSELAQSPSVTIRKLSLKLLQRIGVAYLPGEVALWRYKMGRRSLLHNLEPGASSPDQFQENSQPDVALDHERSFENVPWERLEAVLDRLLLGLCDSDNVVRWSAAKGVGRCTMRLDRTMADDVVSNIVSMFDNNSVSMHHYWHGGLLALAEFCRRGILLPHRLESVVPIVCQGMVFEESLGTHSVGSNVRDAACYVAWSFARAYSSKEMAPFAKDLSSALIVATLFDREVNVRRAACAAFQESVGRHGLFPAGIACNTIADYFSIGIVSQSYTSVAMKVGAQQHYTDTMISHLFSLKIGHWDCSLRRLACESLAMLCGFLPDIGCARIIPDLLTRSMSESVPERHGAITALACLLKAFWKSGRSESEISPELKTPIRNLIPNIEKARLYRGRGGELARCAVCELIEAIALLRFPLKHKTIQRFQMTINENLVQPNELVRDAAVECLSVFSEAYYDSLTEDERDEIIHQFAVELGSSLNVAATRGYALAVGALPIRFVHPRLVTICSHLVKGSQPIQSAERLDAETRQFCLQSLVRICCRLSDRQQCELVDIPVHLSNIINLKVQQLGAEPKDVLAQCVSCLMLGLEDYATDNRGDIGSWVRMSAVQGLEEVLLAMVGNGVTTRTINTSVISAILKQSAEKLDKVRRLAGETLSRLVLADLDLPLRTELRSIFSPGVDWSSAAATFPLITPLLRFPDYRADLFSGLVISAGGLTATVARHALQSLSSLLSQADNDTVALSRVLLELTARMLSSDGCDIRVVVPIFNTLGHLLNYPAVKAAAEESIIDQLRNHVLRQCRISRLVTVRIRSIDVLCGLLHYNSLGNGLASRNFSALVTTLQHKFPKVRKVCAESFYSNLLALDADSGLSPDDHEAALNALISTSWEHSSESPELFAALNVAPKKTVAVKTERRSNDVREFQYQEFIHDLDR